MKQELFSDLFVFKKKSKVKAGDGKLLKEAKYPFYTSSNKLSKSIDFYAFKKPSLIFGTGGMPSIHFNKGYFSVSTDCLTTQPKDEKKVWPQYVYHFLAGNMHILEVGFKGAGLKHISKNYISKIQIPLPPLKVQQKIAAILDQADRLIQLNRELIKKYDELSRSLFLEMFGDPAINEKNWQKKKCGDFIDYLVDIGSNGANKVVSKNLNMFDEENYALMIRTTNFSKNDFETNLKYISKEAYEFFKKSKVYGGEIIMNKIGSAGDFWMMPKLDRPVSLGLNQFLIRLKEKEMNTIYFYYFLSTDYGRINIKSKVNGVATKSITKTAVKELPILAPPIKLQNQFSEKITLIKQQQNLAKKAMKRSEELFQSLLQKAFKGELIKEESYDIA
jgi:type I restriction enzyme S subunit